MVGLVMKYFAYGSNMSLSRLRERTPSARRLASCTLSHHALRFHKAGKDGSGKCNAFETGIPEDFVMGALFEIGSGEKPALDQAEGLGFGYDEKIVLLTDGSGGTVEALTYYATSINEVLKPYSWYKHHVLVGAEETALPPPYVGEIQLVESCEDPDRERDAQQRAIHD